MTETTIAQYITDTFPGVEFVTSDGYTFFFFGSERKLPFATLATADNDYDRVSNLDRPGIFRLNIGVSKQTFQSLFGAHGSGVGECDYTVVDKLMPHPDYAPQGFLCVLNPGVATLEIVRTLLAEAYDLAVSRHTKRESRG